VVREEAVIVQVVEIVAIHLVFTVRILVSREVIMV
jgi:hypothetical protein